MSSDLTTQDMFNSLFDFEEIAIAKHFGATPLGLGADATRYTTFCRALIFIDKRRGGLSDVEALDAAKGTTVGEALGYFAGDAEQLPETPTTSQGKDA